MTRRQVPANAVGPIRAQARRELEDVKEHGLVAGTPGYASIDVVVKRVADDARAVAQRWPAGTSRRQFWIEYANEAGLEAGVWAQTDPRRARFYAALGERLGEMADAERE